MKPVNNSIGKFGSGMGMKSSTTYMKRFVRGEAGTSDIEEEQIWRRPVFRPSADGRGCNRIGVARWMRPVRSEIDTGAVILDDTYVIGVSLRLTHTAFFHEDRLIFSGYVLPGMFQLTSPGSSARAIFYNTCDVLHLFVPHMMLHSFASEVCAERDIQHRLRGNPAIVYDSCIQRLALALMAADQSFLTYGRLYIDSIGVALLSRLVELLGSSPEPLSSARRPGLPHWKLKRAIDYIEAHLATSISLEDVANAAGLTRMHFAAQFRATTGVRPHDYLMKRRVERAQELLVGEKITLIDVAQRVGFQSQSHFTTVFRRFVGATPKVWRDERLSRLV
jgi:AraC-like DNA-binding protein